MYEKADFYKCLSDESEMYKVISKPGFKVYFKLFKIMDYKHPRPLIFRALCDFKTYDSEGNSLISKNDFTNILQSSVLFMFKFLSFKRGDSKDSIKYFKEVAKTYYRQDKIDTNKVINIFKEAAILEGLSSEVLKNGLMSIDFYSQHSLGYSILSLVELIHKTKDKKGNDKTVLLDSQAYFMLSHISDKLFEIDHLLPQSPKKDDEKFKYYKDNSNSIDKLVLKENHDFPSDLVNDGMEYKEFESRTLNKLGNIRLSLSEENKSRGNKVTHLPNKPNFTKYQDIKDRAKELADLLVSLDNL